MTTRIKIRNGLAICIALAVLTLGQSAQAADTTTSEWTGTTDTTWGTSTNWNPNTIPSTTVSAKFDTTFSNQPALDAARTAQGLWLATGVGQDVSITAASSRTLTITGTATLSGQTNAGIILDDSANHNLTIGTNVSVTLSNNTGFYVNNAGTLTLGGLNLNTKTLTLGGTNASGTTALTGVVSGTTGSIVVNTSGTVKLSASNTFTGGFTLTSGTVITSGSSNALGQGTLSLGGGILQLAHASTTSLSRNTTVTANAQITSDRSTSGNGFTYTFGTLSIGAQTLTIAGGTSVTGGTAGVTFGATTLTGNATFSTTNPAGGGTTVLTLGAVADGGSAFSLTKSGNGTLVLANANTYTGTTTISVGTLQLGSGATTGTLSTSSSIVDNGNLTINRSNAVTQGTDFSGSAITGTGSVTETGGGTLTLNVANSYIGGTTLLGPSTLAIGDNGALGSGTLTFSTNSGSTILASNGARSISNNVVLAINGIIGGANDLTISGSFTSSGALSRTLTVNNSAATTLSGNVYLAESDTARGLTINGTGAITISGVITNNAGANTVASNLTKSGANILTVTANNTYTGTTTISASGGTLEIANNGSTTTGKLANTSGITVNSGGTLLLSGSNTVNDRINNSATINLNGGTFNTGGLNEGPAGGAAGSTAAMGALTLTSGATIDFTSANSSNLLFASLTYTAGNAVTIAHWTGTQFVDSGAATNDRLLFISSTGLTDAQLASFQFTDDAGNLIGSGATEIAFNGYFELVPVPEPSTWGAAALAFLVVGYMGRKRFGKKAETLKL